MSKNRITLASEIIKKTKKAKVLDLGCRDSILLQYSPSIDIYHGVDIDIKQELKTENIKYFNVNLESNFNDKFAEYEYDYVVALDVIEHLDNPTKFIDNLKQINTKKFIISTPNMFYWLYRIKFLFGSFTGKYDFNYNLSKDRHKWLVSNRQAIDFMKDAFNNQFNIKTSYFLSDRGRSKHILYIIDLLISKLIPNLISVGIIFEITLKK